MQVNTSITSTSSCTSRHRHVWYDRTETGPKSSSLNYKLYLGIRPTEPTIPFLKPSGIKGELTNMHSFKPVVRTYCSWCVLELNNDD